MDSSARSFQKMHFSLDFSSPLVYYSFSALVNARTKVKADMKYITSIPIYLQVVDSIKEKIVTGTLSPGERLPSGRDLAQQYTINPNTSVKVYQTLEQEELCFTRRGLGTFVTEDSSRIDRLREEMAQNLLNEFLARIRRLGISKEKAVSMIMKKEG